MTALLLETLLVWFIVARKIELKSYGPQTRIGRSLIQHCVRVLQAHIYIAIYLMTTYYVPNEMTVLLPAMHCFIRKKLASYTAHCGVVSINHVP